MGLLNCLLYDKDRHQITNTMKAFIFLCLVAAAMAEADPQFLYGNYGYNTFPSTYAYGGAYSPYTYGYNSFHYGKREAEADPALIYGAGYHYPTVYSGLSHGVYNTHYTTPYVYGGIYNHGIYSGFHYGKRSAEAEPKADAALIYSGIHSYGKREAEAEPWRSYYGGYSGYGRGYGYSGYGGYGGYRGYRGWY